MKIKRMTRKPARIEMLPLIDIVFLLLVFFIYSMLSMAVHNGLQLDLPESTEALKSPESPLSLFIQVGDDGLEISLNDRRIELMEIAGLLAPFSAKDESGKVLVFAAENVSYQQLYQVLDQIKRAGLHDVSLQANRE